jgi:hypothetical protein
LARATPILSGRREWVSGHEILYFRVSYETSDAPPDSSWLHLLDLTTGTDTPVLLDGQYVSLAFMRAAPDGRLAAVQFISTGNRLVSVDVAARHLTPVYDPGRYIDHLQWFIRPSRSYAGLIFETGLYHGWIVKADGTGLRRFAQGWGYFALMAPDGESFVTAGTDQATRAGILDIMSVDDLSGASRRHLTSYAPPPQEPR